MTTFIMIAWQLLAPIPSPAPPPPGAAGAPTSIFLVYEGGKGVQVAADGTVRLVGGAKLDDASRAFWEQIAARVKSQCGGKK